MKTNCNFCTGKPVPDFARLKFNYSFRIKPGKSKLFYIIWIFLFSNIHYQNVTAQATSSKSFNGPVVYINLMLPSGDSLLTVDGTAAMYGKQFSCSVDNDDALKISNFGENISLFRDDKPLAIEARAIPKTLDTLFIRMWALRKRSYALQIATQNIPKSIPGRAWLVDKYLHARTSIDFYNKTTYNFTPVIDSNNYADRFMIVFNRVYSATPVKMEGSLFDSASTAGSTNVNISKTGSITVFPNPIIGNTVHLQFINMPKGNYSIILSTNTGEPVFKQNLVHNGGNNNYNLSTGSKINSGIYSLIISKADDEKLIHLPIIINK